MGLILITPVSGSIVVFYSLIFLAALLSYGFPSLDAETYQLVPLFIGIGPLASVFILTILNLILFMLKKYSYSLVSIFFNVVMILLFFLNLVLQSQDVYTKL